MTSDLSLIEVTAAPGKPIAPSGEPGDEFMPLMKSVAHHVREVLLSFRGSCETDCGRRPQAIFGRVRRARLAGRRAQLD